MCATKAAMAKLIAIKGSKDGLRLQLDEQAAWEELLDALRAQISQGASFFNGAQLVVDIGERTLAEELAALGFELLEDLDHEGQETRYFAGRADGLRPVKFHHFVHARL